MDDLHEMDDFDVDDTDDGSSDHNFFPTRLAVPEQSPITLGLELLIPETPLPLNDSLKKCKTATPFLAALGISSIPDNDELFKMLELRGRGRKEADAVFYCLFNFVACLTGLGVPTNAQTEKGLWEVYATVGLEVLTNFVKKEQSRTGIFANTVNNTWPAGFPEYMSSKYDELSSDDWCVRNGVGDFSEQSKKRVYGEQIIRRVQLV